MKKLPDKSIDLVLTDPPYGTTQCAWDIKIDFGEMWICLKRLIKKNCAICLFGGPPFGSSLVMSNPEMFKHDWIWKKNIAGNFAYAKFQPLREHDTISVFCIGKNRYFPIYQERNAAGKERSKYVIKPGNPHKDDVVRGLKRKKEYFRDPNKRLPSSVQEFNREIGYHPTQKPVPLLEYLIKTYTLEGDTVLDFTMGSGSTGVACKNIGRKFIGIEKDEKYFEIAKKRIETTPALKAGANE
jgi:site-specific DNA-methyltransferase (adenine-specific)